MAEYEPCVGATSEWFTPPEIFEALGLEFDNPGREPVLQRDDQCIANGREAEDSPGG
jgi:hypothetical protein